MAKISEEWRPFDSPNTTRPSTLVDASVSFSESTEIRHQFGGSRGVQVRVVVQPKANSNSKFQRAMYLHLTLDEIDMLASMSKIVTHEPSEDPV